MCGIAGIYDYGRGEAAEPLLKGVETMLGELRHRGPDESGVVRYPSLVMGMDRLSIIDISGGSQPMREGSGRYSIVFNGEIYNYRELKRGLESRGFTFRTSSDTEAILLGFMERGPAVLDSLEGMFAFAIYDSLMHELFIARDRLGKKPLYYLDDGKRLIFSSEVRALLKSGLIRPRVNTQSYWDYLTFRYIPGIETSVEGVRKLPAGHYMRAARGNARISRYWEIPAASCSSASRSPVEEFGRLFRDAVRKRLAAEAPAGAGIRRGSALWAALGQRAGGG